MHQSILFERHKTNHSEFYSIRRDELSRSLTDRCLVGLYMTSWLKLIKTYLQSFDRSVVLVCEPLLYSFGSHTWLRIPPPLTTSLTIAVPCHLDIVSA